MSKFKTFFEKIKSIKHIHIYLAVLVAIVVCLFYFSWFKNDDGDKNLQNSSTEQNSTEEYVDNLEHKLCNVIAKIDGVGQVSVAITLQCGFTYEYATDSETKTSVSGDVQTSVTTETVVWDKEQPVVVKVNYPVIKGVVVVANGAKDFSLSMKIRNAIHTILDVDEEKIVILY